MCSLFPLLNMLVINTSSHAIPNPDMESEQRLLMQLAPELDETTVQRLVASFHDLRKGFDEGRISYPYSLRGLAVNSPPFGKH